MKRFLGSYVRLQYIKDLLPKKLASFEIDQNILFKDIFLGQFREKFMAKRNETKMFLKKAIAAYKICSGYLLKKIPINKTTLRHLSAIDPQVQGHKVTPNTRSDFLKL